MGVADELRWFWEGNSLGIAAVGVVVIVALWLDAARGRT